MRDGWHKPVAILAAAITDATAAGRAMLTAVDAAAQRVLLGVTTFGSSLLAAADAAAARVLLGVTAFGTSLLAAADAAAAKVLLAITFADLGGTATLAQLPAILAARMSFHANKNAVGQAISDATVTKVTFTTEEWDIGGAYDAPNSKWTPTVAGKYLVGLQLRATGTFAVPGGATAGYIYKNGAVVKSTVSYAASTTDTFASVLTTVNMNGTTDFLEAYVYSDVSAGSPTVDGTVALVFFYGALLQ